MDAAIRSMLHVAIDAGLISDVTLNLPDREAIERQIAVLVEQGWEAGAGGLSLVVSDSVEWWQGYVRDWRGDRLVTVTLCSQPVPVQREEGAAA